MFDSHLDHVAYGTALRITDCARKTLKSTSSASSTVSSASSSSTNQMENCALCEDKFHESEENEPLVGNHANNFPNSYSYPLFCNHADFEARYNEPVPYQRTVMKSCSLSSIGSPGYRPNFSPSYLDCRLRYIRQTRRIQKHLRITPEGHLLVNDVKQYTRRYCTSNYCPGDQVDGTSDCETFHPVSTLISVSKLRRIHAAYWNLESRQDLQRSRSAAIPELNSIAESKANTPSPKESMTQFGSSNADNANTGIRS